MTVHPRLLHLQRQQSKAMLNGMRIDIVTPSNVICMYKTIILNRKCAHFFISKKKTNECKNYFILCFTSITDNENGMSEDRRIHVHRNKNEIMNTIHVKEILYTCNKRFWRLLNSVRISSGKFVLTFSSKYVFIA